MATLARHRRKVRGCSVSVLTELIIILLIVLLIFGGTKLPKLARSLGQAQKEFKKGLDEGAEDAEDDERRRRRRAT